MPKATPVHDILRGMSFEDDTEDDPFGAGSTAASGLVSATVIAALVSKLAEKGLLSDGDVHDIYDDALHSLEREQAEADPEFADLYRQARRVIEEPLREMKSPPGRDAR